MTPHYADPTVTLYAGDCLGVLRELPDASVDAVVTDPPYGLEFMGKDWDSFGRDTGNGYQEKPRMNSAEGFGGYKERPNFYTAGQPFQRWCELWTAECLRALKPGGHLLAFGGTRTWHRLACAVEDAGFEVRDSIAWLYGSGFPKSLDVSKAIDKARGDDPAWRVVGQWLKGHREAAGYATRRAFAPMILDGHKNLESAAANLSNWENGLSFPTWEWWLSLKTILSLPDDMDAEVWRLNGRKGQPGEAWDRREVLSERVTEVKGGSWAAEVASGRFRLGEKVIRETAPATPDAERWQGWGTALKPAFEPVVVARKPLSPATVAANVLAHGTGALNIDACRIPTSADDARAMGRANTPGSGRFKAGRSEAGAMGRSKPGEPLDTTAGRWPANVVLDDTQADALDQQSGESRSGLGGHPQTGARDMDGWGMSGAGIKLGHNDTGGASRFFYAAKANSSERVRVDGVSHPTVKPLDLMRWLVRLVTPPGGTVLEPFAGSGTTVEACILEGFRCIAIEREADYLPLITQRIHRRRDPIAAVRGSGEDGGLFDLLAEDGGAA